MRRALSDTVAGLIAGLDIDRIDALDDEEEDALLGLADVATRCRTAVERVLKDNALDLVVNPENHERSSPEMSVSPRPPREGGNGTTPDRGRAHLSTHTSRDDAEVVGGEIVSNGESTLIGLRHSLEQPLRAADVPFDEDEGPLL